MPTYVPDFSDARVLVAGDVMLDRYWHGDTSRISPEAPVPVVKITQDETRPGGAGNVAVNITALGAQATLIGLVGADEAADLLTSQLEKRNVNCSLIRVKGHPTITKLRVVSRRQQLIRLDFEENFATAEATPLPAAFEAGLAQAKAVVISDYAKGTLTNPIRLIAKARALGLPVVVDPKGKDFTHYRGATAVTPNLNEFEAVVGKCDDEATLLSRGRAMRDELNLDALIITRSERGMTLITRDAPPFTIPTRAREVYDVTGAGDTVVGVLGAALSVNTPMVDAVALANLAAGIVVGKMGTASVSVEELKEAVALGTPRTR